MTGRRHPGTGALRTAPLALTALALAAAVLPVRAEEPTDVLGPGGDTLRLEVRGDATLVDPGTPLDDALAAWVSPGDGPAAMLPLARSADARGRFELEPPARGGRLLVWAPGRAPAVLEVTGPGEERLVLEPSATLGGFVRRPGALEEGIPGADVVVGVQVPVLGAAADADDWHRYSVATTTDDAGHFVIPGLGPGPLTVTAGKDGWVDGRAFPVTAGADEVVVQLTRGATVRGLAQLRPGGEAAMGVTVAVAARTSVVDADGRFEIDVVPPGTHRLEVSGAGIVAPPPRTLVLRDAQVRSGLRLDLVRAAVLRGRLGDARGRAVAEAEFHVTYPPGVLPEGTPLTSRHDVLADAEGAYRLPGLHPADGVTVTVRAPELVGARFEGLVLRPGEASRPLDVTLDLGGSIIGTLVDDASRPVPLAHVAAWDADPSANEPVATARSAPDGVFILRGVTPGDVSLIVTPGAGSRARVGEFGPFPVLDRESLRTGPLRLSGGSTLRGRIVPAVADAVIAVSDDAGLVLETNAEEGRFTVHGLAPGPAAVSVTSPSREGGAEAVVRLPASSELVLEWIDLAHLELELRDETGEPVPEAWVEIRPAPDPMADPDRPGDAAHAGGALPVLDVRDAQGVATARVPPGRYRITARTADGLFGVAEADATARPRPVSVTLGRGEAVQGHVADEDTGDPVEGATVVALPIAAQPWERGPLARSDERGFFRIEGVPAGVVRLRVEADGYAPLDSRPNVVRQAESPYIGVLELRQGVRVHGRITAASSVPAVGARVVIESVSGSGAAVADDLATGAGFRADAVTDLYGRYEVAGVPAGEVLLTVQPGAAAPGTARGGARDAARTVRALVRWSRNGHELDVDLAAGTPLAGRVSTGARAEPFADVTAWSLGDELASATARTDAYGRFELPPLPPGPLHVEVEAAGSRVPWSATLELADAAYERVELELPESSVSGRVVTAEYGDGVAAAFVRLYAALPGAGFEQLFSEAVTGATGGFLIDRVPPGAYRLEVDRRGYGVATLEPVVVEERDTVDGLLVLLPEEAVVSTRLVDANGRAVPGAYLLAVPYWARSLRQNRGESADGADGALGPDDPGTARTLRVRADGNGRVRLARLSPGEWELFAAAPGFGRVDLGIHEIRPGEQILEDVVLERGSAIRVQVLRPPFAPAAGVLVHVLDGAGRDPRLARRRDQPLRGPDPAYVTSARGSVLVTGLAPGVYTVWIEGAEDEAVALHVGDQELRRIYLFAP